MSQLKIYFLSSEVAPFSETYELASYSRKISSKLHNKEHIDLRVAHPKYGYISERKYILREVIRLKDLPVNFDNEKHIINMKSSFIPETRVQVYFVENNLLYKELPELIYKARNGRVYTDIDSRFAFFTKATLETLQSLFWVPNVIICNDWQMSILPILLKQQFIKNDFYSNIKTLYIIHSINDYRNFSLNTYEQLNLKINTKNKIIDNHIQAINNADYTIVLNYEKNKVMDSIKKEKQLSQALHSSKHQVIDIPKEANRQVWNDLADNIDSICKTL